MIRAIEIRPGNSRNALLVRRHSNIQDFAITQLWGLSAVPIRIPKFTKSLLCSLPHKKRLRFAIYPAMGISCFFSLER